MRPAVLGEQSAWLGLFINEGTLTRRRANRVWRSRASASCHERVRDHRLSACHDSTRRGVAAVGSAAPVGGRSDDMGQVIDLGAEKREAEFRLGSRLYRIRLHSEQPDYCDAVIVSPRANGYRSCLTRPNLARRTIRRWWCRATSRTSRSIGRVTWTATVGSTCSSRSAISTATIPGSCFFIGRAARRARDASCALRPLR